MRTCLITGAAGFIGSHVAERLLARGDRVIGLDNFDPFYSRGIKEGNLSRALPNSSFRFVEGDIRDESLVGRIVAEEKPDVVFHSAAKAGVRPSIADPLGYEDVNVRGTLVLLEAARKAGIRHFVFASSSSVYGENPKVPFSEDDFVDHPISPYAATKKAGELIGYTVHHLSGMPVTCLRFFTVYGPRQRPDLAIHKFTRLIDEGKPIPVFGDGSTSRDYTYIDDIVDGVVRAIDRPDGYKIINLGESTTVTLSGMIAEIERALGKKAAIDRQPLQPGDVPRTYADVEKARRLLGYEPRMPFREGIERFVAWYRETDAAPTAARGKG